MTGLLTVPEAAARLGLHHMTIRKWIASGKLPACKLGRLLRVRVEDVDAMVVPVKVTKKEA